MSRAARTIIVGMGLALSCGLAPAHAVQEAAPQKHDNAEARQLLAQAEQAAEKIQSKEDKVKVLEDIARAKAHAGDYDGARLIARALGTNGSKAKILQEMAVQQALGGDVDLAIQTVGGIAGGGDKVHAYSEISEKLSEAHENASALSVLQRAVDVNNVDDKDAIIALMRIGHAMAKAGIPEATSNMATKSKEKGPIWNDINATLLVVAKAYNHDMPGARAKFAVLHEPMFKALALYAMGEAQSSFGDKKGAAATYKELIPACQVAAQPEKMILEVAHLQHQNGDDADAEATIASLIETARTKGKDDLLGDIADLQARDGNLQGAQKTLALIKTPSALGVAWQGIAFAKAKAGDVPGALAVAPKDADPYGQSEVLLGAARGILEALKPNSKS